MKRGGINVIIKKIIMTGKTLPNIISKEGRFIMTR